MNLPDDVQETAPAGAWLSVSDELLWGFNHALSNRLAAISAITRILEYSDTGLDPLISALTDEIDALDRTLALLRLIPRNPDDSPEPIRLEELLPSVLDLHRLRGEVRNLEFTLSTEPDTLPVWVEPGRLAHTLLLLLVVASRHALTAAATRVEISLSGDEDTVVVTMESIGSEEGDSHPCGCTPNEARFVQQLLASAGVETTSLGTGSRCRIELRIPSLVAVRRGMG